MELGAQVDDQALLFVGLDAHQALVLRVVQQFAEFLEAVFAPVEIGLLLPDPLDQFVGQRAVVDFEAMGFEHVAQQRNGLFGLGAGLLRQRRRPSCGSCSGLRRR